MCFYGNRVRIQEGGKKSYVTTYTMLPCMAHIKKKSQKENKGRGGAEREAEHKLIRPRTVAERETGKEAPHKLGEAYHSRDHLGRGLPARFRCSLERSGVHSSTQIRGQMPRGGTIRVLGCACRGCLVRGCLHGAALPCAWRLAAIRGPHPALAG